MGVAQTSIENYYLHRETGLLGTQCEWLLFLMQRGRDYSRSELADLSGLRLSSVCGRVNELLAVGRLTEAPRRVCLVTGRTVKPVMLKA